MPLSRYTAWMCGEYFVPVLAGCFSCGGCSGTGLWGKLWTGFLGKNTAAMFTARLEGLPFSWEEGEAYNPAGPCREEDLAKQGVLSKTR